ncbi:MAG: hypothetical protein ACR2F8_01220, partial [Caulobacteraceae bacterium]
MNKPVWSLGVAGLGTVGAALVELLAERPEFAPAGARDIVTGVCARSRLAPRPAAVSTLPWFDDPVELARSNANNLFVELIGGSEGPARGGGGGGRGGGGEGGGEEKKGGGEEGERMDRPDEKE